MRRAVDHPCKRQGGGRGLQIIAVYNESEVRAHCRITGKSGDRNIAISAPCFANNGERIFNCKLFSRFHTRGGKEMRNIFGKAKRKTAWRTLSLLLTLSLILGMISVSAYAALVPGETDQPAETGTETGAETDIFVLLSRRTMPEASLR